MKCYSLILALTLLTASVGTAAIAPAPQPAPPEAGIVPEEVERTQEDQALVDKAREQQVRAAEIREQQARAGDIREQQGRAEVIREQQTAAALAMPQGYLGLVIGERAPAIGEKPVVMVQDVAANGPGAAAGVLAGDVIFALDDHSIQSAAQLAAVVQPLPDGVKVVLHLLRGDRKLDVPVVVSAIARPRRVVETMEQPVGLPAAGDVVVIHQPHVRRTGDLPNILPPALHAATYLSGQVLDTAGTPVANASVTAYSSTDGTVAAVATSLVNGAYVLRLPGPGVYGLAVSGAANAISKTVDVPAAGLQAVSLSVPAPPQAREFGYLGLMLAQPPVRETPPTHILAGVPVLEVAAGSPGAAAGVQAGDIILTLNDRVVTNSQQVTALVQALPGGRKVLLHLSRKGQPLDLTATTGSIRLPAVQDTELEVLDEVRRTGANAYVDPFPLPAAQNVWKLNPDMVHDEPEVIRF